MPTLSECLDTFLKIDRSELTNHQYGLVLRQMARAIGPDRSIELVTYEDLIDYLDRLRKRPHHKTGLKLKPATIAGYVSIIKAFFDWCAKQGYVERSPARHVERKRPPRDPSRSRAIPPDELERIVEYARVTSPRNYALVLFLSDTAARAAEAASLTLKNLQLSVRRALILGKGGDWEWVHFEEETENALRQWLKLRPHCNHGHVWTGLGPDYAPLTPDGISAVIRSLSEYTGASRKWGAHSIRHAVAHGYADLGVPATITQRKLRHSHPSITLDYYYPDGERLAEEVSRRYPLAAFKRPQKSTEEQPVLRIVERKKRGG